MVACCLAVIVFNVVIDPYGVFDMPRIEGVNAIKSRAGQRERLLKQYRTYSLRPSAIILGNSRAQVGFDPQHHAWPPDAKPVLNLAVPGTGLQTARMLLAHAGYAGHPKVIVLGVDFVDFRLDASSSPEVHQTLVVEPPNVGARLQDYISITLSLDTLLDSVLTVRAQYETYPTSLTPAGFNPMLDYIGHAKVEGYGPLFAQRDEENAKNYLRGGKKIINPSTGTSPDFESIRALLRQACSMHAQVHMVIYPYHAHILELFHYTGLWGAFEDWKRELVKLVDSEASKSEATMRLWDFSGYSAFTTEAVPDSTDRRSSVRWYWEAGHFKKELGDVVLDRVLGSKAEVSSDSSDFGVVLSPNNIEAHLESIRLARANYQREHKDEIVRLSRLVERLKKVTPHE
jgi:hypothetical protein